MIIEKNSLGKNMLDVNLEMHPSCQVETQSPRSTSPLCQTALPTVIAAPNVKVAEALMKPQI